MVTHQNPSKMLTSVCTPMYSRFAKEQLPILTKVEDLSVHYEYPLCNIVPKKLQQVVRFHKLSEIKIQPPSAKPPI